MIDCACNCMDVGHESDGVETKRSSFVIFLCAFCFLLDLLGITMWRSCCLVHSIDIALRYI